MRITGTRENLEKIVDEVASPGKRLRINALAQFTPKA
jgi:hypothetical protein